MKRMLWWLIGGLVLAGCSAAGEPALFLGLPWWLALLVAGVLIALFVWWLYSGRRARTPLPPPGMPPDPIGPKALDVHDSEVVPTAHDDLTRLEGIGPQTAQILGRADIHTYARLANTPVAELARLLEQAGLRGTAVDPQSWPAQATLAAAGNWEELAALQARLVRENQTSG